MVAGRTRIRNRSWGHLFESCEFEVPQRCGGVEQYLIGQRFGLRREIASSRENMPFSNPMRTEYIVSLATGLSTISKSWKKSDFLLDMTNLSHSASGFSKVLIFSFSAASNRSYSYMLRMGEPSFLLSNTLEDHLQRPVPLRRSCRIPRRSPKDGRVCGFQVYQQPCCFHDRESQDMPPDFP